MPRELKTKDPDETLDFIVDFAPLTNSRANAESDWLASGDTISSHVVTVASGLTLSTSTITNSSTSVTLWLTGGTEGAKYPVEVDVTTAAGRVASRSFDVQVESK